MNWIESLFKISGEVFRMIGEAINENRMRAMKMKKETLMSSEGLLLEDVYEHVTEGCINTREGLLCQR